MKTILIDAVNTLVDKNTGLNKELFTLLESFPNKKIILTGANQEQIQKYSLNTLPYKLFTLNHNPEKTNPEYFKIMLKHFNLTPQDTIYIEHKEQVVKIAQSLDITSHHYNTESKDVETIKIFIEQNL